MIVQEVKLMIIFPASDSDRVAFEHERSSAASTFYYIPQSDLYISF